MCGMSNTGWSSSELWKVLMHASGEQLEQSFSLRGDLLFFRTGVSGIAFRALFCTFLFSF